MQKITSFFLFSSGADTNIIEKCPTDKSKYVGIGATIFFTGLFAALAASYALYTVFDSIPVAAALGLVWGLMIFNLDRYIVSSMRKDNKFFKELIMATPRLLLAISISLIIAKPLELKIFEKEIESELVLMEQQSFAKQDAEVKSRFTPTIDQQKSEILNLKDELIKKAALRDELVLKAQQEADGTGGSMRRNLGPIYKVKKADADRAENELKEFSEINLQRIEELETQLSTQEALLLAELTGLAKKKLNGPAARLEALNRISESSTAIWWANLFIILLFIILETTPILVKLISRSGPYDSLLHIEEHSFLTKEIEVIAVSTDETKKRSASLGQTEQSYVTRKLDAELT